MGIIFVIIFLYIAYLICLAHNNIDMTRDKKKSIKDGDNVYRDLKGSTYLTSNDHKVMRSYDSKGNLILKDLNTQKTVVNYKLEEDSKEQSIKLSEIQKAKLIHSEDSYVIAKVNDNIRYMLDYSVSGYHYNSYDSNNFVDTLKEVYQVFEWENRTCLLVTTRIDCENGKNYLFGKGYKFTGNHYLDAEIWVDIYTGECKPRMSTLKDNEEFWCKNGFEFMHDFKAAMVKLFAKKYQEFIKPLVKEWNTITDISELNKAWFELTVSAPINFHKHVNLNEIGQKYYPKVKEMYYLNANIRNAYKDIEKNLKHIENVNNDNVNIYNDGVVIHKFFLEDKDEYIKRCKSNIDFNKEWIKNKTIEIENGKQIIQELIDEINNI